MESVDVCIIGAGMAGASAAYFLAPHAGVLLLEREPHAGYHSTARSAALYAPLYGPRAVRLLTRAAGPFLKSPPAGFVASPVLSPRGYLTIGTAEQDAAARQFSSTAAAMGQPLVELSVSAARQLIPALRADRFDWALLDESAMDIDVDGLFQGFLRGARSRGARLALSREIETIAHDGRRWQLRGPDLQVSAQVLVNAAGAWADRVALQAGVTPLTLIPHRRTAFIFDAPNSIATASWPMVSDAADQFYFKPDAGRLLGSLSEEVPCEPCDAQADDFDVAVAVDRIEQFIDFPIQRVLRSWTGLRTFGPDREPVSGFDPAVPNFYWHAALGGYGIQTSAALGAFAAAMITRRALPESLSALDFDPRWLGVERLLATSTESTCHS